jgi:uridine kinase
MSDRHASEVRNIIGISGGSGSGKTTLANALLEHYAGEALVISYDRYYKRMPCGNYDIPESLDTELLLEHLHLLKSGKAVEIPIYRINGKRTNAVEWVEPKPIIIVEGIFALYHPALLKLYKRKIYVDVPNDSVRFHRRLVRDIRERGDTEAKVTKAWAENVLPKHYRLIQPQMARAEVVVSGEGNVAISEILAPRQLRPWLSEPS